MFEKVKVFADYTNMTIKLPFLLLQKFPNSTFFFLPLSPFPNSTLSFFLLFQPLGHFFLIFFSFFSSSFFYYLTHPLLS